VAFIPSWEKRKFATDDEKVPAMPLRSPEEAHNFAMSHRVKNTGGWLETFAMVARSINRTELKTNTPAREAMNKEHTKLSEKEVWLKDKPREWSDVAAEATSTDSKVHVGTVFGICVEKGSELEINDPERKFKGPYVFQGNRVKDEYSETALFNELGSSPASMEASKAVDGYGLLPGHDIQQADAQHTYTQAMLGDKIPGSKSQTPCQVTVNTWVRLPPECRTPAMAKMRDPVVPLIRALYGHPDAGGYWERHCDKHLRSVGFVPASENWPSTYFHPRLKLFLMVYVDDFKMGGS